MMTIATMLWAPNRFSQDFSAMYTPEWADKLARGFRRNLTTPHRFICFTDRDYEFAEPIEQIRIKAKVPNYSTCIEPYALGEAMILCGLDTVIVGNIDHLAEYCMTADTIALPRDPYMPSRSCNGVALVPDGMAHIATDHRGENDMDWLRAHPHVFSDDIFPGQICSYKGSVIRNGLGNAKIVYLHGVPKMHELADVPFVKEHWR